MKAVKPVYSEYKDIEFGKPIKEGWNRCIKCGEPVRVSKLNIIKIDITPGKNCGSCGWPYF